MSNTPPPDARPEPRRPPPHPLLGHALTVVSLALGGLSSFHALRAEVVELRAGVGALTLQGTENTRRTEADVARLRDDLKELRGEIRDIKAAVAKAD